MLKRLNINYYNDLWPEFTYDRSGTMDLMCRDGIITLRRYPTGITVERTKCRVKPKKGRECPWCELSVDPKTAARKQNELRELLRIPMEKGAIGVYGAEKLMRNEYGGRDDDEEGF